MLKFDPVQQHALFAALGAPEPVEHEQMLAIVKARFPSYHEVEDFAKVHGLNHQAVVDFWP